MMNTNNINNSLKQKHKPNGKRHVFLDVVLSWSLSDVLNKHLYKFQVEKLPLTFSSITQYVNSFFYMLFEETHADLLSQLARISHAPATSFTDLQRVPTANPKDILYRMTLHGMNYLPKLGDLIALTQLKPKCIHDLHPPNTPFITAFVTELINQSPPAMHILLSDPIQSNTFQTKDQTFGFAVYLTNLTTNMRIWQALNSAGNMNVIQTTLSFKPSDARNCDKCKERDKDGVIDLNIRKAFDSFKLDTSQEAAVLTCLSANKCTHQNSCTKLIWGPPGTGKTKTVASLLFVLLRKKSRTLTCAPTNIAVIGVGTKLLSIVRDHDLGYDTYGFGDILVFGNEERMKINDDHKELSDVFLDNRIDVLLNCLTKWKTYVNDMVRFLENPLKEHSRCIVWEPKKTKPKSKKNKTKKNEEKPKNNHEETLCTFEQFVMNKFNILGRNLICCIKSLYTHLPTSVLPLDVVKKMHNIICLIQKAGEFVKEIIARNGNLKEAFDLRVFSSVGRGQVMKLRLCKTECLQALKELQVSSSIPKSMNENKLKSFCLRNVCLIFCTASGSIKLLRNGMMPIEMVVIDEAAQLKECESVIPLKLPGVRNAVLIGDERQLPSMVQSKICEESKFGRSLFERLVLSGHEKHLLKVQYRMYPSISQFPNTEFYNGQILDGPNVINRPYGNLFLKGGIYGSYSFINVDNAKEEFDNNYSTRNMVEVAVIAEIIENLFKESVAKKQTLTVGCISPYKAQVEAIEAKLGKKYNREINGSRFSVNVRSVDGFQGGEEDVIIFSTVRCNRSGSVGFLSSRERANVSLTRARHCMWIVGNKETMIKSGSVWSTLVFDAENRGCVFNAHEDKDLAQAMVHAMVELSHFSSLLKTDSMLFKESKWKVNFSNTFLERIASIMNINVRKRVVSLLIKLSSGWREIRKSKRNNLFNSSGISNLIETYNVDGHLYLVWSVDIVYENSLCVQVLRILDLLSLSQIKQQAMCLERAFGNYTLDKINRCQAKRVERNDVFPMTWPVDPYHDPTRALTTQLAKLSLSNKTRRIMNARK